KKPKSERRISHETLFGRNPAGQYRLPWGHSQARSSMARGKRDAPNLVPDESRVWYASYQPVPPVVWYSAHAAQLRTPELNRRRDLLQTVASRKEVRRIGNHEGFDPRIVARRISSYLGVTNLLAHRELHIMTRHLINT